MAQETVLKVKQDIGTLLALKSGNSNVQTFSFHLPETILFEEKVWRKMTFVLVHASTRSEVLGALSTGIHCKNAKSFIVNFHSLTVSAAASNMVLNCSVCINTAVLHSKSCISHYVSIIWQIGYVDL